MLSKHCLPLRESDPAITNYLVLWWSGVRRDATIWGADSQIPSELARGVRI